MYLISLNKLGGGILIFLLSPEFFFSVLNSVRAHVRTVLLWTPEAFPGPNLRFPWYNSTKKNGNWTTKKIIF